MLLKEVLRLEVEIVLDGPLGEIPVGVVTLVPGLDKLLSVELVSDVGKVVLEIVGWEGEIVVLGSVVLLKDG